MTRVVWNLQPPGASRTLVAQAVLQGVPYIEQGQIFEIGNSRVPYFFTGQRVIKVVWDEIVVTDIIQQVETPPRSARGVTGGGG